MLEAALGDGNKKIEANENHTIVLQRRCVRAARALPAGTTIAREDVEVLRPAPSTAIPAQDVTQVVGRSLTKDLQAGQEISWDALV
jgi:N-acetylneuraminate synthase